MAYIGPAPANSIIATSDIEDGAVTSAKLGGNIVTPGTLDVNGQELILDANANTSITADTDDQVDIKVGGTDVVTLTNSSLVLKGTTPTLTIGDAGTEDTKIVFDGNAQDFHIGLDDTADDLVIGLGSALGTTTHMAFTESGEILKPLQPAFGVHPSGTQSNIAINTEVTVVWGTELFDVGANFASNTFTAPVTGKYILTANLYIQALDTSATYYQIYLITSNRTFYDTFSIMSGDADGYFTGKVTVVADMDASDTSSVVIYQSGGTQQIDLPVNCSFSGALLC
mgnify:CR=1 FL=1